MWELKSAEYSHGRVLLTVFKKQGTDSDLADDRIMHQRFTIIAGILPFISDEKERGRMFAVIQASLKGQMKYDMLSPSPIAVAVAASKGIAALILGAFDSGAFGNGLTVAS